MCSRGADPQVVQFLWLPDSGVTSEPRPRLHHRPAPRCPGLAQHAANINTNKCVRGQGEPTLTAPAPSDGGGFSQQRWHLHFLPDFWAAHCSPLPCVSPSPSPLSLRRTGGGCCRAGGQSSTPEGVGRRELLWAASGFCSQPEAAAFPAWLTTYKDCPPEKC